MWPCVGALERPFDLAKGRERRVEGRSGNGVARAGSASRQVPMSRVMSLDVVLCVHCRVAMFRVLLPCSVDGCVLLKTKLSEF